MSARGTTGVFGRRDGVLVSDGAVHAVKVNFPSPIAGSSRHLQCPEGALLPDRDHEGITVPSGPGS